MLGEADATCMSIMWIHSPNSASADCSHQTMNLNAAFSSGDEGDVMGGVEGDVRRMVVVR